MEICWKGCKFPCERGKGEENNYTKDFKNELRDKKDQREGTGSCNEVRKKGYYCH